MGEKEQVNLAHYTPPGNDGIDEFRRLTNKRDAQCFKFRELCSQLPDDDL